MFIVISVILLWFLLLAFLNKGNKLKEPVDKFPDEWSIYLENTVEFYRKLTPERKREFEYRVKKFILNKTIKGVSTEISFKEPLLVASSAIIPMFNFPEYYYPKLKEILIYPEHFDADFQTKGEAREILGLVGSEGILNQTMILSKKALFTGYQNTRDGSNVGIHEFIHLIDNSDNATDGLPTILMTHDYTIPFLKIVNEEINLIQKHKSDINPYGSTNKAEFFAVASEYFFENPSKMKKRHPQLYSILMDVFKGS